MRRLLFALSQNPTVKDVAVGFPPARRVVDRFVPGESIEDAVGAVRQLAASGIRATIDHLGEYADDRTKVETQVDTYLALLERLGEEHLTDAAEVSIKASALGQGIDDDLALTNARRIASAAREVGTTMTIDAEDHTRTDATLALLAAVRQEYPDTGGVLQAMLHRTPDDCRALATAGSRIRLCKGAYDEPPSVAHRSPTAISDAFLTCLRILLKGDGYPMIATHDPRLIAAAQAYLDLLDRPKGTYEFQMLYGIRPDEQRRLAASGHTVRVYVPFGDDWYAYFMRRLAEKPANLALLGRALLSRT